MYLWVQPDKASQTCDGVKDAANLKASLSRLSARITLELSADRKNKVDPGSGAASESDPDNGQSGEHLATADCWCQVEYCGTEFSEIRATVTPLLLACLF